MAQAPDYAALAAQHGGQAAAAAGGKDYSTLAAKFGGTPAKAAGPSEEERTRAALDRELVNEDYAIPGTSVRVPHTRYINQFLVATGRGIIDLWAGGKQIALSGENEKTYTREQENELGEFAKLQKESPVIATAGRVTGQVAPTLVVPAGAAAAGVRTVGKAVPALSVLSKAGAATDATVMGGLQGAMNFVPEGESRGVNTALSAATAGLFTKGLQTAARAAPAVLPGFRETQDSLRTMSRPSAQAASVSADDIARALQEEGVDFAQMPAKVREGLVKQAQEAADAGAPVSPAELARVARAQGLPVPAELTKGQMTRDPNQLRTEFDLRRTAAGGAIETRMGQQEEALEGSLEVIKMKTGGASTPQRDAETGRRIAEPILRQAKSSESRVSALYKQADTAGETLAEVNVQPLAEYLIDNRAASVSVPEIKAFAAKLRDMGIASGDDLSNVAGAKAWLTREPTVRELEELRKFAVQLGQKDEAAGHFMREVKNVIDGLTAGKGGELYQKARAARIDHALKFEDPGVVNRLIEMKSRTDRVTPFEDVFRVTVLNSSADDLTRLRGQLLEHSDNPELRTAGVQAFKDMRAATLDYLKLGAINNAKEEWSHAGFKRAVESIGPEKLEVLFGKNTSNQIQQVLQSSADMRAVFNKAGIHNPGTASALVNWLERITGLVGLGKVGTYTGEAARAVAERLSAQGKVAESLKPLEDAFKAGATARDEQLKQLLSLYAGKVGAAAAPGIAAGTAAASAKDERR